MNLEFETVRSRMSAIGVDLSKMEFSGRSVILVKKQLSNGQDFSPQKLITINPARQKRAETVLSEAITKDINMKNPQAGYFTVQVGLNPHDVDAILEGTLSGFQVNGWTMNSDQVQVVSISFLDKQSQVQQFRIPCQILSHPYVVVANYAIPRGQILRHSDFTFKQLERFDPEAESNYFTQIEDVAGKESERSIQQGRIINREDIREIPLVRANEIVDVIAQRGTIRISTKMKAGQEGVKGEFIPLKSLDGKKTVIAQVVGLRMTEIGDTSTVSIGHGGLSNPIRNQTVRITGGYEQQQRRLNENRNSRQYIVPVNGNDYPGGNSVKTGDYSHRR